MTTLQWQERSRPRLARRGLCPMMTYPRCVAYIAPIDDGIICSDTVPPSRAAAARFSSFPQDLPSQEWTNSVGKLKQQFRTSAPSWRSSQWNADDELAQQ